MTIIAIGINHKTAPVEIREQVAFDQRGLDDALSSLAGLDNVSEAVILSTCNRTELYCAGESVEPSGVLGWLENHHGLAGDSLNNCTYIHQDTDAVDHIMRVASGLDSLVLGEPQIFGQLKSAYVSAQDAKTVRGDLDRLFQHSFSIAKRVRTETAIGENPVSVAATSVELAKQIYADFSKQTALLIGAGKTTELVARHLRQQGIKDLIIANRTLARAQDLASEVNGQAVLLGDIPDKLVEADIVIASTASQLPILGKGAVERALKLRKHRPFFMVDIAVPRDIEPQVGELSDVYLYTVDDLKAVIDENLKSREGAAKEAEAIISQGRNDFFERMRASTAGEVLKQFRSKAESIQQAELEKALGVIKGGGDPEVALKGLARSLTNKLIHAPTVQVRSAATEGRTEASEWMRILFELNSPQDKPGESDLDDGALQ